MPAPMFERIVALGEGCIACLVEGRRFGSAGSLPITKRWVGSPEGGARLAQVCLICDQFPSAPHIQGTR